MARMSDHIITVSENSKKDLLEICGVDSSKITVVYNAVSDVFVSTDIASMIIKEDYMLYVGTVDYPGKNVHNAIKAFEIYKRQSKNALKFVICGMQGKGFDSVADLINKSDFKTDIIYFGYAENNELLNLYTFAKLFIFISYYEGFGLPVLEAMKFGVPVITANTSSLPEVVGDAAVVCDPDDISDIREAICKIVQDQEYANQLVKKGYENLKRFSWEETAKATLDVFRKCLKKPQIVK
jgi:glycosyltransferase involved in cell wall biosynthesis